MKKSIPIIAALLSFTPAYALGSFTALETMGNYLVKVFSLSWITDVVSATKFAFFITLLSVIYAVLYGGLIRTTAANAASGGIFRDKKAAGVVAFAFAAIATIFIPDQVAFTVGSFYSTIFVILFAGIPSILVMFLAYKLTSEKPSVGPNGQPGIGANMKPWARHGIRLLAVLLALTLVSALAAQYGVYV